MRVLLLCSVLLLTFFTSKAQKNTTNTPAEGQVVTGTLLVNERTPVDFKVIRQSLVTDWNVRLDSFNQAEKTMVLYAAEATVMLAWLDYPAAPLEIKSAAEGAWLWNNAAEEAPRHQAQVVVSVIGSPRRPLDVYKLYTKVVAAALDNTRSSGVYLSSQYLLQSKAFFLQAARSMDQNSLPLYCWIYFGMFQENDLSSGYSFGLTEFGMPDLEINRSKHSMQEVHAVLYDAVSDALQNGVTLKEGSMVETLEGQKIALKLSKATFWEGQTLKVSY